MPDCEKRQERAGGMRGIDPFFKTQLKVPFHPRKDEKCRRIREKCAIARDKSNIHSGDHHLEERGIGEIVSRQKEDAMNLDLSAQH